MSTTTPRLGFYEPADDGSEPVNVSTDLNDNLEKLDASIGFVPSTSGTPPTSPFNGMATYETDTGAAKFYKLATTTWSQLLSAGSTFLSNILLDKTKRIGIGNAAPASVIDIIIDNVFPTPMLKYKQTAEAYHRIEINYDGFKIGGGSALPEVKMYRPSAGTLAIDAVGVTMTGGLTVASDTALEDLNVSGNLQLGGVVNSDFVVNGSISATGKGIESLIWKQAVTQRASTVTLTIDPDFQFTALANTTYFIEVYMIISGLAAGDFQATWTVPSGTAGFRWCVGMPSANSDATSTAMRTGVHQTNTPIGYGTVSDTTYVGIQETLVLTVGSTGGTIGLNWAQLASSTTNTTIRQGSLMRYRIVA